MNGEEELIDYENVYHDYGLDLEGETVRAEEFKGSQFPKIPKFSDLRIPHVFYTKPNVIPKPITIDGVRRPGYQKAGRGRGRMRTPPSSEINLVAPMLINSKVGCVPQVEGDTEEASLARLDAPQLVSSRQIYEDASDSREVVANGQPQAASTQDSWHSGRNSASSPTSSFQSPLVDGFQSPLVDGFQSPLVDGRVSPNDIAPCTNDELCPSDTLPNPTDCEVDSSWPANRIEVLAISETADRPVDLFPNENYCLESTMIGFAEQPYMFNRQKAPPLNLSEMVDNALDKSKQKKKKLKLTLGVTQNGIKKKLNEEYEPPKSVPNSYSEALNPRKAVQSQAKTANGKAPKKYDLLIRGLPTDLYSSTDLNDLFQGCGQIISTSMESTLNPLTSAIISFSTEDARDWAFHLAEDGMDGSDGLFGEYASFIKVTKE